MPCPRLTMSPNDIGACPCGGLAKPLVSISAILLYLSLEWLVVTDSFGHRRLMIVTTVSWIERLRAIHHRKRLGMLHDRHQRRLPVLRIMLLHPLPLLQRILWERLHQLHGLRQAHHAAAQQLRHSFNEWPFDI